MSFKLRQQQNPWLWLTGLDIEFVNGVFCYNFINYECLGKLPNDICSRWISFLRFENPFPVLFLMRYPIHFHQCLLPPKSPIHLEQLTRVVRKIYRVKRNSNPQIAICMYYTVFTPLRIRRFCCVGSLRLTLKCSMMSSVASTESKLRLDQMKLDFESIRF